MAVRRRSGTFLLPEGFLGKMLKERSMSLPVFIAMATKAWKQRLIREYGRLDSDIHMRREPLKKLGLQVIKEENRLKDLGEAFVSGDGAIANDTFQRTNRGERCDRRTVQVLSTGFGMTFDEFISKAEDMLPWFGVRSESPPGLIVRKSELERMVLLHQSDAPASRIHVLGNPGSGKACLLSAMAADSRLDIRARRIWFADLSRAKTRSDVETQVIVAIGLTDAGSGGYKLRDVIEVLNAGPGLLLLSRPDVAFVNDTGAMEALLAEMCRGATSTSLLLSTWRVVPKKSKWHQIDLGPLPDADSKLLFTKLAIGISPGDPDLPPVIEKLGGLPLALVITANYVQIRGIALSDLNPVATVRSTRHNLLPWQMSLSQALDWSYFRLGDSTRRAARLLAIGPIGMARQAYLQLSANQFGSFENVGDLVLGGFAKDSSDRIELTSSIRGLILQLDPPSPDEITIWCRYYLKRVGKGISIGREGGAQIAAELRAEAWNIHEAIVRGLDLSLLDYITEAIGGFARVISGVAALPYESLINVASRLPGKAGAAMRGKCLAQVGDICVRRGKFAEAREAYLCAIDAFGQLDVRDVIAIGHCKDWLGDIDYEEGDFERAMERYQAALNDLRSEDAKQVQVDGINGNHFELELADCLWAYGRLLMAMGAEKQKFSEDAKSLRKEARAYYEEADKLFKGRGSFRGRANCQRGFAAIYEADDKPELARAELLNALLKYTNVGLVLGCAHCHADLGRLYLLGEPPMPERALDELQEALRLYEQVEGNVSNLDHYRKCLALWEQVRSLVE